MQNYTGLHVAIDCKLKKGIKRVGEGDVDEEGKFKVSLPKEIVKHVLNLKKECYAQLHSAAAVPCPAHGGVEATKIVFKSQTNQKVVFAPAKALQFSTALCTSKLLWPFFEYPPLPKIDPWKKDWPKITFPPLEGFDHPWSLPPTYKPKPKFKPLPPPFFPYHKPPPVPTYKPKPKQKPPVFKPLPPSAPVYKPPTKPIPPPFYKPTPKPPVFKPLPPKVPVYKPPVVKPLPPSKPFYKPPVVKPIPPAEPSYKPPVVTEPLPPAFPLFPFPPLFKKPCPPFAKFPPKNFDKPAFGYFPKLPPFDTNNP